MSRTNPFVRSAIREGKILYESRLCTNRGCSRSALRSGGGRTDAADGVIHEVVWTEGGKRKPRWFRQAEEDLKSAEILFESGRFYMVCFVAQQIAEKAVKSFLYYKGREIVLGHSLEQLCREAARFDRKFEALRGEVSILDNFYIPARYPNGLPDSIPALVFNKKTAGEALRLARKTLETVRGKIGPLQES
ncbi:MAG: HEPN domain-containing protein [Chloroflexi bacterium]|nr:HEPN domain-containing protein [Chloroflexota bacterium]